MKIEFTPAHLRELVNGHELIVPERVGQVDSITPAIVINPEPEKQSEVSVGNPERAMHSSAHSGIEGLVRGEVVCAYELSSQNGSYLALDYYHSLWHGGVDGVREGIEQEYDEIFVGGDSHKGESKELVLCTAGLIREAAGWVRNGVEYRLTLEETQRCLARSIDNLNIGNPLHGAEVIRDLRSGAI